MLAAHAAPACPRRDRPWVLLIAILGSSLAFVEGSVVNLALPSIQDAFAADATRLQWVVNAYLLPLGAFMLIGGAAGDRFGLRRVFVVGNAVFGLGAVVAALASSLPLLIGARVLQGVGGALLVPASLALISTHFPAHERGRAIGTWAAASALTTALGPVLGGWLVDVHGWPAVFLIVAPWSGLVIALSLWRVPGGGARRDAAAALDYTGAALLAAALGALTAALVVEGGAGLAAGLTLAALVLGLWFLRHERRVQAPMLPLDLFRSRPFSGSNLMTLLLYGALSGTLFFLPFNLIQVQEYSAMQAGAALLPFTLILGLGSRFAGALSARVESRRLLTLGPVVTGAGFAALALPGTGAGYVTGFLPGIALIGVGMTLSVAPLTTVVMTAVDDTYAGVASGINNTAARLSGVLAVAAMSVLAIGAFGQALQVALQPLALAPEVSTALMAQTDRLAQVVVPGDIEQAAAVRAAVDGAFVAAFRTVALCCALIAALSGAVAWLTLAPGQGAARART